MKNSKVYGAILFSGVLLCAIAMLSGCSSKVKHSGFLVDYTGLEESDDYKVDLRYINPQKDLSQYDKFILEPVRVHFAPAAKGTAIDPDKLKDLSDFFKNELVKGLSENYTIVEQPGQGVMRLRMAMTSVKKTEPLLNVLPSTKATGAGLGGAAMEVEGLDSIDGVRVVAAVDYRSGNRIALAPGLSELGHAKAVMKKWAEEFVELIEEAHERD
ncbi:MAG: DUF3313 domain-containing protein [Planctomycetota bacterium]|jgi:hypothetical protein